MAFTFIRCKDAWSSNYRYIESDIAPLVGSETPYNLTSSYDIFTVGNYYQTAVFGGHDYIYIFALFDSEPTITQNTMGHNLSRNVFYDSTSGLWVLMAYAGFGLKEHWTDRSGGVTCDCEFFDYINYDSLALTRQAFLEYIKTIFIPPYNWQSVPSISGKNGILLLSTIQSVYLNDGEPVNNALESYINFIDDSKVAVLVEQEIDDLTKVTVKYIVPAGTYEYIKLVYKVGSAPTSITDGTAVDILQAAKQVSISGIADGNTYFFKIFTDITESEPYEFTTVRPVGAELFKIDLSTDGHDIMRHDPNKIINVEYSYYGELRPWFSTTLGALTDAGNPSQPAYTISNGELTTVNETQTLAWAYDVTANQRIIPANCTLWFEFDAYFLNSEGYLDWRMYNDQSSEVIYWCWDTKYSFGSRVWYNCQLKASVVNGIINRIEYYVDHTMVHAETNNNIHMLCIDETNPVPLYYITFTTTKATNLKNMQIYWE